MARRPPAPETCAVCGADIPAHARACPECGADERTGWRESSPYDGLDLPAEAWADDDAPEPRRPLRRGPAWYWVAAAIAVLLAFGLALLGAG